MHGLVKVLAWLIAVVVLVGATAAGLAVLAVRTQPGHDYLLRLALQRVSEGLEGEVQVAGIRASSILTGFRLTGITVRDRAGTAVLEADSLEVRYSFGDLLRRNIVVVPARLWRPRLLVERTEVGGPTNLELLLRPRGPPVVPGSGFLVSFRDTEIVDGEVVVRLPTVPGDTSSRWTLEQIPERSEPARVFRFTDVSGHIDEADLIGDPDEGQRISIDRLAATAHIVAEPFRVEDFSGLVERYGKMLSVTGASFRLGGSSLAGDIAFGWEDPAGTLTLDATIVSDDLHLADLRWIEPRLPDGEGAMTLRVSGPLAEGEWQVATEGFRIGSSRVAGTAGVRLGQRLRILPSDMELLPLDLADVTPWMPDAPTLQGRLTGRVSVRGELNGLAVAGDVTYEDVRTGIAPGSGALTARFQGGVGLGEEIGVSGLSLTLEPLHFETLSAFFPTMEVAGEGRLQAILSGTLSGGIDVDGEFEHWGPEWPRSRVVVMGRVQDTGEDISVALDGTLDLLSLDGLAGALDRELPVSGMVSGNLRADGPLGDVSVSGSLFTEAGFVQGSARFDVRDPARAYQVDGSVEEFRLHSIVAGLPDPTVVSGDFAIDGVGAELDSLSGSAYVSLRESRIAGVELDFLESRLVVAAGSLNVDQLELVSPVLRLSGSGSLPLREGQQDGEVFVIFSTTSLAALRPVFFGADPIAADTLTQLERDLLLLEGVNPDTLAAFDRIALDGSAEGEMRLTGSLEDLSGGGFLEVSDFVYGVNSLGAGRADFLGYWGTEGPWGAEGVVDLEDLSLDRYAFESASGEIRYEPGQGAYRLDVRKDASEEYRIRGTLSHDSVAVAVALESLEIDLDTVAWVLDEPTAVRVTGSRVEVDSLRLTRSPAADGGEYRIDANGVLDLQGESDLHVELEGVDLAFIAGLLQTQASPDGVLDLTLDIDGPGASPRMTASLAVDRFSTGEAGLSRVEGALAYFDQILEGEIVGELDGSTRLSISGRIPMDLSFREVEERVLEQEMDVTLLVDSLPAAPALAFLEVLEEVEGNISGQVEFEGTPSDLRPSGEIRLSDGSVFLSELGIRPSNIGATLRVLEDGLVDVVGSVTSGGTAQVSGQIDIADARNPRFALMASGTGFQAVNRRDMVIRLGGEVGLDSTYADPQVSGLVRVEEGELFLEEFARTVEVVDLTDPGLLEVLDTTSVGARPVVEAAQNPFLQNLRVNVDLGFDGNFWLRSPEMNVEIAGGLTVTYARSGRELLLEGDLQAIRGTYDVFSRQFRVESGTVQFVGTPGINPALNIQTRTRLRREGGEPLDITAQVQGTLVSPRVVLSSDAQPPIAESDLISYLIFGRPSYALASGETTMLRQSLGAGGTVFVGTLASQLGSVVGRQVGFDYFSITQPQDGVVGLESAAGLSGSFAHTQIEVGRYVGQDLFLALVVRPLTGFGAVSQTFPGARIEWRFTDTWSVEGFVEDRFAREASTGFGALGVRLSKVLGLSLFREWGY